MDAIELVDDIAQQVAADHPILHNLERGSDDIPPVVTIRTGERAQIAEQARTLLAIGARRLFVVDDRCVLHSTTSK